MAQKESEQDEDFKLVENEDEDQDLEEIENRLSEENDSEESLDEDLESNDEDVDLDNMLDEISDEVVEEEKANAQDEQLQMSDELAQYNIDDAIKKLFKDAIDECEYQAG